MASSFLMFLDHTQRRITIGRTPLDERSAPRRGLYLQTHNTHNRQTSMPPVGFEPTISAGGRSQTYALDRAATGTGDHFIITGPNQALISSAGVLPCDGVCCITCSMLNSFFSLSSYHRLCSIVSSTTPRNSQTSTVTMETVSLSSKSSCDA